MREQATQTTGTRPSNPARIPRILVAGLISFITAVLFSVHSYFRSVSITFCDATVRSDEGLVSLQIPLVRLASSQPHVTKLVVYERERGANTWTSNGSRRSTLRNWMAQKDEEWFHGAMVAGFGYWRGDWQNDSRPGRFIVFFMPIWAIATALFLVFAITQHFRVRWTLRSMLVLTLMLGVLLRLLTLREVA